MKDKTEESGRAFESERTIMSAEGEVLLDRRLPQVSSVSLLPSLHSDEVLYLLHLAVVLATLAFV